MLTASDEPIEMPEFRLRCLRGELNGGAPLNPRAAGA
jgi:hypothetical protein